METLRAQVEKPDELRKQLERYVAETGDPEPLSLEELVDHVRNFDERFTLDVGDRHPLSVSLRMTPEVAAQLITMNWGICDAPTGSFFITGDCPLTVFVPRGRQAIFGGGLALPAVQVTFPISPTACLFLNRRSGGALRRRVGEQFVREVNRRTAFAAERFVISPYKTRRVAEWVRAAAVTVGRPKLDKNVLIRQLQTRK